MIYLLDTHMTKCAGYYAVEHLKTTTREALQVLSDASRVLIDECRVQSLEKRMKDVKAEVKSERHYNELERNLPFAQKNIEDPLALWCIEDEDAWEWVLEFATDLIHETRNWTGPGPDQVDIDASCWLRVNAPRPVNAGRILRRRALFPLPEKIPKEFITPDLYAPDVPLSVRIECTVRVYRLMYWTRYRNLVKYTGARKPWWWHSFDETLAPALASSGRGK